MEGKKSYGGSLQKPWCSLVYLRHKVHNALNRVGTLVGNVLWTDIFSQYLFNYHPILSAITNIMNLTPHTRWAPCEMAERQHCVGSNSFNVECSVERMHKYCKIFMQKGKIFFPCIFINAPTLQRSKQQRCLICYRDKSIKLPTITTKHLEEG